MNNLTSNYRTRALVATAAMALLAIACSASEAAEPVATTQAPATTTTVAATTTTAAAVDDESIQVTAFDYGYEGLPATVKSGTSFTLANASDVELHEMVIFQLSGFEARALEEIAALPPDRLELVLGPPSAVILAPPGGAPSFPVVGDGTLKGTGRYVVFCFIPTGADVDEYLEAAATSDGPPQVDGGPPHFTVGMLGEFIVEADS